MDYINEPLEMPGSKNKNAYDDGNIPEIDLPGQADATNIIPDEVPRTDGPGGE